ncbi:hypothetical protein GWK36_05255 [Caldichromatium japonicum]|uniref:ATP-grasp domain-containing protein n=1 Tax=Caldichromatium japonicum TaxID=2699430 RepID=A0A6G7VC04_9GAMM|nr:hypothetical protein [Caldichromatium japonicum]QIK37482.1 hypothetical protein GWK36_05255 [Caldichromatium japonicum]
MFIGIPAERSHLFRVQPRAAVAVSDPTAWRLYPVYRQVYDRLQLALDAGLRAAPCGVEPCDCGFEPDDPVFVKPIINLYGAARRAGLYRAAEVPPEPGLFWCEALGGEHTSTDCLVQDGEVVWMAHSLASEHKDRFRPLSWEVGIERPLLAPAIREWVERHLGGYTGLCNLELIGGRPIEAHLRGSTGFFDLYGPHFIPAWVALVDGEPFRPPPPIPGGWMISVFSEGPLTEPELAAIAEAGARVYADPATPDRVAVVLCPDRALGHRLMAMLGNRPCEDLTT